MKLCPFCAEEIQDEAVKCRHCGEWLNKRTPADLFNIAKGFVSKKIDEYQESKTKHLFTPEPNRPIELKHTKFYPDYFIYKDRKFSYDQIHGITMRNHASYINGIPTEKSFALLLFVKSEHFVNDENTIDVSVSSELLSSNKKKRELAMLCGNWIAQKTLKARLSHYAVEIQEKGFFSYTKDIQIHNEGDLYVKGVKKVNLVDAFKNGQIWYGVQTKSLLGADKGQDPYTFRVNKTDMQTSFFGYGTIAAFDTAYNKDAFDILINRLFSSGAIL